MEQKDIKYKDFLTIWWSFFWRYLVFSMTFAAISGLIGAFIVVKLGYPELTNYVKSILLWISVVLASFVAFRSMFSTKFKNFSIVLIKN